MWGGTLAENVTQAISRDILRDAILESESRGYDIILHVHDSEIAAVLTHMVELAMTELREIMTIAPIWAEGLPLGVKFHHGSYYS